MTEIVSIGNFRTKPGKEADARAASEALLAPTHAEEGCLLYALHVAADDPARLAFVERWASQEALERHAGTDHVAAMVARLDELFDSADIVVYEPVPGGDPLKGSLAEHTRA